MKYYFRDCPIIRRVSFAISASHRPLATIESIWIYEGWMKRRLNMLEITEGIKSGQLIGHNHRSFTGIIYRVLI